MQAVGPARRKWGARMLGVPARRLRVSEAVVSAELEDEAVLLHLERGIYFGLDLLGATIWRLLSQGANEDEIVAAVLAEYDVEPDQLRADLAEFLGQLEANGLVLPVDG